MPIACSFKLTPVVVNTLATYASMFLIKFMYSKSFNCTCYMSCIDLV